MAILKANGALSLRWASYYKNLTTCLQADYLKPDGCAKFVDCLTGQLITVALCRKGLWVFDFAQRIKRMLHLCHTIDVS